MQRLPNRAFVIVMTGALLLATISCDRNSPSKPAAGEVVLYTSIDEPVARPIVAEFEKRAGIKVILKTDTEATKTAGLVATLRAEKANPQADVFWNNEPFHTINLAEEGVLAAYESPAGKDILPQYKDPQKRWCANGLRLRMIARAPTAGDITKIEDLTDPRLKGKICMAFPATGTTSGQVASWFVAWGPEKAEAFLKQLKANDIALVGGNSEVVKQIATGNMLAGLTDNDDVDSMICEVGAGKLSGVPANIIGDGPLAIPCTVALIAGAKHDAQARQLIDYLLSPDVEARMISEHFASRTARPMPTTQPGLPMMRIDYVEVARMMPRAIASARKILEGRQ